MGGGESRIITINNIQASAGNTYIFFPAISGYKAVKFKVTSNGTGGNLVATKANGKPVVSISMNREYEIEDDEISVGVTSIQHVGVLSVEVTHKVI